jgi:hypothetical protein
MLFKLLVIAILLLILFSLFSGLVFLIKDQGSSTRTVKALTLRIALSLALFALLMVGMSIGLISPHSAF